MIIIITIIKYIFISNTLKMLTFYVDLAILCGTCLGCAIYLKRTSGIFENICTKVEDTTIYVGDRSTYYTEVLSQPTVTLPPPSYAQATMTTPLLSFTKL